MMLGVRPSEAGMLHRGLHHHKMIPLSRLSDVIGGGRNPLWVWFKLRVAGCLDPAARLVDIWRIVREAQSADDREVADNGFSWASWNTRVPGMLTREDLLSKKGCAWAQDFYFERKPSDAVDFEDVPARSLRMSSDEIGTRSNDPIFVIRFEGTYPPGSAGNEFAREMEQFVRSTLRETSANAVMLDLTELDYEWGDAIAGMAIPFLERRPTVIPVAIVASPPTAAALRPLLVPNSAMGVAGFMMFDKHPEAIAHLEKATRVMG